MQDHLSSQPPPSHDESQRRGRLVLQTLHILLIPIAVALFIGWYLFVTVGISPFFHVNLHAHLVAIVGTGVFFSALIMLVRLGRPNISVILLIGVWTLVTAGLALVNGVSSIWPALLILPICAAGLLLDGAASISLAALATLLVLIVGWLEPQGLGSHPVPLPAIFDRYLPILAAGFWVALFWMIAALTFMLANGLRRAVKDSRAQADALRELSTHLEERVSQQTAELLEQSSQAARMEERTRVARDIHDTLAQGLTGVVVQLGAAQRALQVAAPDAEKHLDLAQSMAREALAEARRSIWNLRAPALERGSLSDALSGLAARASRPETKITFEMRGEPWILGSDAESSLLRVCQEALVNISKHAGATEAKVMLEYAPEAARLTIRDNGEGFEDAVLSLDHRAQGPGDGFGLLGMRERIEALGGTLTLSNDEGAVVQAEIPRELASQVASVAGQADELK